MTDFPTLLYTSTCEIPFTYLKPEKDIPFSLPIQAIIGSTPPSLVITSFKKKHYGYDYLKTEKEYNNRRYVSQGKPSDNKLAKFQLNRFRGCRLGVKNASSNICKTTTTNQCKRVPDLWRPGSVKIKRYYAKSSRLIPTAKKGKEMKQQ